MEQPQDSPKPRRWTSDNPSPLTREIDSRELMQGAREIVIRHAGESYRLSVTRSGKLILRK